ncbi:MAG: ATP-binding protein [Desulfovibrio sp.]|uniref:ATP-binding protein n=1 Tax=Desulfovibrio sp. TaxID=885 RepID=UPI00258938F6|nr:ATP-binding protein [Desulfovibrio sp.]MCD7982760.1 ATP-binding protein [Desulfovibrio sp.]
MQEFQVELHSDHLESLTTANPLKALEELIYNALDADAKLVEVLFRRNVIGGIDSIVVQDDGTGIAPEAEPYFRQLGGSWKKDAKKTKEFQRLLHGKHGKGRFKAFALGEIVEWSTCFKSNGKNYSRSIYGNSQNMGKFSITDPSVTERKTGTNVIIQNVSEKFSSLSEAKAIESLTTDLALYLKNYNNVFVFYNNSEIDPGKFIVGQEEYPFSITIDEETISGSIVVCEWSIDTGKAIYFCDNAGFVYEQREHRIYTSGFNISAYIKSESINENFIINNLQAGEFDKKSKKMLDSAKKCIRKYCRDKSIIEGQNIIEEWKKAKIYPYSDETAEDNTDIKNIERQVFDVVALNINEHIPEFQNYDNITKRLSFSLIREALENSPASLNRILESVIALPKEKIDDLNSLLKHTSLSNVISASKKVADRLSFLAAIEYLVFEDKRIKERSQLHKILEENTWIFGEEFHLTVSDKSLDAVLEAHLSILDSGKKKKGREPRVLRPDGKTGVVDLMLSRRIPEPDKEKRSHLIIELKRPSQKIDFKAYGQLLQYAGAVVNDARFAQVDARWIFWAVSTELSKEVEELSSAKDRPEGLAHEGENFEIWIMPWSKLINRCRARLSFFKEELKYDPGTDQAIAHLQELYAQYVPEDISSEEDANSTEVE